MSTNTLMIRIVRPVVRRIAHSRVTPNNITTLRLVTGVAAAIGFAQAAPLASNGRWHLVFSMLLDRADGGLARQTQRSSVVGHRYDLVSDCASNILAFVGIGIGVVPALGLIGPCLACLRALA